MDGGDSMGDMRIAQMELAREADDDVADPRLGRDLPVMNQYIQAERTFVELNVDPAPSPVRFHKRRSVALWGQPAYQ
jgi:hypothetical protein